MTRTIDDEHHDRDASELVERNALFFGVPANLIFGSVEPVERRKHQMAPPERAARDHRDSGEALPREKLLACIGWRMVVSLARWGGIAKW
jgi:hypothetical protein